MVWCLQQHYAQVSHRTKSLWTWWVDGENFNYCLSRHAAYVKHWSPSIWSPTRLEFTRSRLGKNPSSSLHNKMVNFLLNSRWLIRTFGQQWKRRRSSSSAAYVGSMSTSPTRLMHKEGGWQMSQLRKKKKQKKWWLWRWRMNWWWIHSCFVISGCKEALWRSRNRSRCIRDTQTKNWNSSIINDNEDCRDSISRSNLVVTLCTDYELLLL